MSSATKSRQQLRVQMSVLPMHRPEAIAKRRGVIIPKLGESFTATEYAALSGIVTKFEALQRLERLVREKRLYRQLRRNERPDYETRYWKIGVHLCYVEFTPKGHTIGHPDFR